LATAEQLARRAVPPSNLSLLGLVRHLVDVEQTFFRYGLNGEHVPDVYAHEDRPDAAFEEAAPGSAEADLARYAQECEAARKALAGVSLEAEFSLRNDFGRAAQRARRPAPAGHRRVNGHLTCGA
jgi:hypothetical protein